MSKTSDRIVLIIGLMGVSLLTGCGVTSTSLPSNLQPAGGGPLSIVTAQFPDAITGRSYYLVLSTTGGSGILSSCAVVSGALPAGLAWEVGSPANTCDLYTPSGAVTGAAGTYSVVVQATDTSSPPKTDQLPYTLIVRPEFSITQASLMDAVQGRPYGTGTGCTGTGGACVQAATTNLAATAPPTVGASTDGNGPISACVLSMTKAGASSNPGFTVAVNPTQQSQCALSSTGVGAAGAYAVTVSVTDNPIVYLGQTVVPANTITIPTPLSLTVNPAIAFSVNFDNYSFTPTGAGTTAEVPDAVQNRTYGAVGPYGTAGPAGGETSLVLTATGGLLTTQGLTFTPPAASTLPAPVQCGPATGVTYPQVSATAATMVCSSGGTAVSGSPGPFPFVVTVGDVGNTATPTGSTMTDTLGHSSHTLKVDAPLTFSLAQAGNPTTTNPADLLDAVSGRSYGVINSGYAAPTYTPGGGLGANETTVGAVGNSYYQWCLSTGALPATFNSTGNNLNVACSTAQVQSPSETLQATNDLATVASTTPYPFTVQLNDTGNLTTPSATLTNSTTLTVQPPLVATLMQNGTAIAPGSALLPGVYNRSYGVIGGTPTFTAAGGLGAISGGLGGNYQWCISVPGLPTGFVNTGTNLNNSSTCASPVVENTATLAANPITLLSPAPTSATQYNFTVRLDDGGNAAVPNGFASGTTPDPANVVSSSILVNPQIQLAQSLGTNWPDAVNGRAYGSPAGGPSVTGCTGGTGACAPAVYSATGGLGGYHWPTTPASISGLGMSCSVVNTTTPPTYSCSAATIAALPTIAGATSQSYSPSATVSDTPNAATPAATVATDPNSMRTDTLWVDSPLLATLNQTGDTPTATNPANLIPGVSGRSYGGTGYATPTYTAAGGLGQGTVGLGPYRWCISASSGPLPGGFLNTGSNVNTPCTSPDVENTATLSASSISSTIPTPPGSANFSFTVELDDPGNGSTPSSISSSTWGRNATSLLINAPLAINLTQAGNAASPNPANLLPAVTNRTYGSIGGTPTYTASYGLGGYTFPASPGPFPGGFACSSTSTNPYTCSAAAAVSAAANTYSPLSVTVSDTGNAAVPNGTATSTTSLLVNPPITLTTNNGPNWPDAVYGRAYGQGTGCPTGGLGNCTAMIYTAHGGLGLVGEYTFPTTSNFPTPIACTPTSPTPTLTLTCATTTTGTTTISQTGGTTHPMVTAVDVANAATPAANTTTDPGSTQTDNLIVDPALGVTLTQSTNSTPNTALLPGVVTRTYGLIGGAPTFKAGGGLGAAGSTLGATEYEWCVNTGTASLPGNLTGITVGGSGAPCSSFGPTGTNTASLATPTGSTITATITPPATYATFSPTVELDDTGNLSTPSSVASGTSATSGTNLQINAEISFTAPGSPAPDAVNGNSYGTDNSTFGLTGCSVTPCATLNYGISNGLGNYLDPGTLTTPGPSTFASCHFAAPHTPGVLSDTYKCSTSSVSQAGSPTAYTLTMSASDTGNAATPGATKSDTAGVLLTVHQALSLAVTNPPNVTTAFPEWSY